MLPSLLCEAEGCTCFLANKLLLCVIADLSLFRDREHSRGHKRIMPGVNNTLLVKLLQVLIYPKSTRVSDQVVFRS